MATGGVVARGRLAEERKTWRRSHPHGFVAKPETLPDGSVKPPNFFEIGHDIVFKIEVQLDLLRLKVERYSAGVASLQLQKQRSLQPDCTDTDFLKESTTGKSLAPTLVAYSNNWEKPKAHQSYKHKQTDFLKESTTPILAAKQYQQITSPDKKTLHYFIDYSETLILKDYPSNPPVCKFPARFFHMNVYPTGAVCLSILGSARKPSILVTQILVGIQDLLDNPNPASAAQDACYRLYKKHKREYKDRVRLQAKQYPSLV